MRFRQVPRIHRGSLEVLEQLGGRPLPVDNPETVVLRKFQVGVPLGPDRLHHPQGIDQPSLSGCDHLVQVNGLVTNCAKRLETAVQNGFGRTRSVNLVRVAKENDLPPAIPDLGEVEKICQQASRAEALTVRSSEFGIAQEVRVVDEVNAIIRIDAGADRDGFDRSHFRFNGLLLSLSEVVQVLVDATAFDIEILVCFPCQPAVRSERDRHPTHPPDHIDGF